MITEENYYQDETHASKSKLDRVNRSPMHYKHSVDNPEQTDPMRFGRAIHSFILEGSPVTVCPFEDFRTKEAREWRDSHTDYVKRSEYNELVEMRDAINDHPTLKLLLNSGEPEKIFTSDIDGVPVKCKVDWYCPKQNIVLDLKSTNDASASAFAYSVRKYRYDVQDVFYCDIIEQATGKRPRFIFIALEKTAPHGVALYEIDEESKEMARLEYLENLETWKHCHDAGEFPGYDTEIQTLVI